MIEALARAARAFRAPINLGTRVGVAGGEELSGAASGFKVLSGIPDIDYLDELAFPEYLEAFRRLENDPHIAKELRGNTAPLESADWMIEPASDSPRDVLIGDFVGANLYQQENDNFGSEYWCRTDWSDHLRDALRMLVNGFSVFQTVYRQQGRFRVLDCMKYLQPASIRRWFFDARDNLVQIERYYTGADGNPVSGEFIQADELFIYTWDKEGSNILGRALIRPMWGSFQLKTRFRKLGMIGTMKTAVAVPYFENPRDAGPDDIRKGEQLAKLMRSGNLERIFASITTGQKIGWAEASSSGTKGIPELITMENREISDVGSTGFMDLNRESGSRGVAGTMASFSSLLITAIAKYVVARQRQRIRPIVDWNFAGVRKHPRAKVDNIDPFQKTRTLPDIVAAIQAKAITNTIDTENELRRRWALMEITEDERAAAQVSEPSSTTSPTDPNAPAARPGQDGPTSPDTRNPVKVDPGASAAPDNATLARIALADAALVQRVRIDAGAILRELEKYEAVYYSALSHVEADMREAVVEMIRVGQLKPTRPSDVKVPFDLQNQLRARLIANLKGVRDYGRREVVNEIRRQALRITAGRVVTSNPATRRGALAVSNQQAQVTADLDVTTLVSRLQAQTVATYHDLAAQGASDEEIAAGLKGYLGSITDKQIAQMARSSTSVGFNGGRAVSILEHQDQLLPVATRLEVADDNSCDPCGTPASEGGLNGLRVEIGSKEWLRAQPPYGCDGGDRCRGFMVVEVRP